MLLVERPAAVRASWFTHTLWGKRSTVIFVGATLEDPVFFSRNGLVAEIDSLGLAFQIATYFLRDEHLTFSLLIIEMLAAAGAREVTMP